MKKMKVAAGSLSIGDLARESGTTVQTIRYYEHTGLLPAPPRTAGNQRRYGEEEKDRLKFIRHARELGFAIEAVRELLRLAAHPNDPCIGADEIALAQLKEVESRIARLEELRRALKRMLASCAHGKVKSCRIIETLADHALCAQDHPPASQILARRTRAQGQGRRRRAVAL